MTCLRTAAAAVLSSVSCFLVASASGCGSDAVGVNACRDIERVRCETGKHCGFVDDVEQCKRFYRDQCLHGLRSGKEPGDIALKECIDAIKLAGTCAANAVEHLADCAGWESLQTTATTPCEAIQFPEKIGKCGFLAEVPIEAGPPAKDAAQEASIPDADGAATSDGAADATGDE
jgi:hypothetical protein